MKKFILLFLSITILSSLSFAEAAYSIKNPQSLSSSSENIITDWDFFWGKFVSPTDKATKADLTVNAPSDWNKYPLPDEIRKIAKPEKVQVLTDSALQT